MPSGTWCEFLEDKSSVLCPDIRRPECRRKFHRTHPERFELLRLPQDLSTYVIRVVAVSHEALTRGVSFLELLPVGFLPGRWILVLGLGRVLRADLPARARGPWRQRGAATERYQSGSSGMENLCCQGHPWPVMTDRHRVLYMQSWTCQILRFMGCLPHGCVGPGPRSAP